MFRRSASLAIPHLSVFRKRAFHLNVPFSPVPCACHLSLLLSFLWTKGASRKACLSTPGDSKTCFSQSADSVTCGALGREKGWHLVRYKRDTRKALYERHFCEILNLKSFAAIPSVSLVQLGHTNRNVFLSHESQCEIALV